MEKGQKVLVTGAAGSIGSALCKRLVATSEVFALDQDETGLFDLKNECGLVQPIIANIRDDKRMCDVFEQIKPDIVYHAAAYKHVPLMEQFPEEAVKTNVDGTLNILAGCETTKVKKMILISSDKAVNPVSVMGMTKRIAEMICQTRLGSITQCIVVRFGNVLASRGSVVPIFKEQIARGGPITITHPNITRYFMSMFAAVDLVIRASEIGKHGQVMVLDMGKPIKIIDLAKQMINLSGKDIQIKIIGLRPGEKMKEALMTKNEAMEQIIKDNLRIVKLDNFDIDMFKTLLCRLLDDKGGNTIKLLKEIVKL